ncbi:hypothetical protein [Legionella fallonii]|uniref:hypothetical protein n=1 Tax=Legionella fallonii TaxID=96230 RepID=UPI0005D2EEEB|nr:hypothetical protein [Legionella fallonii]
MYERVTKLNIPVEKKSFIRFSDDPAHKGIIVSDGGGGEELNDGLWTFVFLIKIKVDVICSAVKLNSFKFATLSSFYGSHD